MCTKLVFLKPISGICLKCKTKEKQQTQGGLKITGKPRSRVSLLQMKTAGESNSSDTLSPTSTCDSTWILHQLYLPCMEGESQQLLQEVLFLAYGRRREAVVSCIYIVFKLKFEDEFMLFLLLSHSSGSALPQGEDLFSCSRAIRLSFSFPLCHVVILYIMLSILNPSGKR